MAYVNQYPDPFEDEASPPGRRAVPNPDGSFSTERSITVTDPRLNGGRPTNIPSMYEGRDVPEEEAIARIVAAGGIDPETGRRLEGYDTIPAAEEAARARSAGLSISNGYQVDPAHQNRYPDPFDEKETVGSALTAPVSEGPRTHPLSEQPGWLSESAKRGGYGLGEAVGGGMRALGEYLSGDEDAFVRSKHGPALAAKGEHVAGEFRALREGSQKDYGISRPENLIPHSIDEAAQAGRYYVSAAVESLFATVLPTIAVAVATKSPTLALGAMGGQVYGQKYDEQRAAGRSKEEASMDAAFYALTEVVTERIPLGLALKEGVPFIRRVLKVGAAEGVSEAINEALQAGYDAGVLDEDMDLRDGIRRVVDAGVVGTLIGAPMGAIGHGAAAAPSQEDRDAEEVRADQGQAGVGRGAGGGSQDQGGAGLQRPAQAGPGPGDRQAPQAGVAGQAPPAPEAPGQAQAAGAQPEVAPPAEEDFQEAVGEAQAAPPPPEPAPAAPAGTQEPVAPPGWGPEADAALRTKLEQRPDVELQRTLRSANLDPTGTREALIDRIVEARNLVEWVRAKNLTGLPDLQAVVGDPAFQALAGPVLPEPTLPALTRFLQAQPQDYVFPGQLSQGSPEVSVGITAPPASPEAAPAPSTPETPPAAGLERPTVPPEPPPSPTVDEAAHEAATSPENALPEPTPAQKEAGNYKKGKLELHGFQISIENPAGSRRRPEWPPLAYHYGYIRGTEGKDKDHVDVFLSPNAEDPHAPVFVVDQVKPDGSFDEHKVMLGFRDEETARIGYLANYEPGWQGLGAITRFDTIDEFREWVTDQQATQVPAVEAFGGKLPEKAGNGANRPSKGKLIPRRGEDGSVIWTTEPVEEPEPEQRNALAEENQGETLKWLFSEALKGGQRFKNITEARAFAEERTGEKIGAGTRDAKRLDEIIERAVVNAAIQIASTLPSRPTVDQVLEVYRKLVDLYQRQPRLGVRTSGSVARQAYSTPVPVAFLASRLADVGLDTTVYEPSAGHGALLLETQPENARVNEIDAERAAALKLDAGYEVTQADAVSHELPEKVDVILTNPPFGVVKEADGSTRRFHPDPDNPAYETGEIDHAIALQALRQMKPGGRGVLLLGSVAKTAKGEARSDAYHGKAKREFFHTLYGKYNVIDHFTVAGELYARQGAGWPIDVVVIEGRGKSALTLPAAAVPRIYSSFDGLEEVLRGEGRPAQPALRGGQRGEGLEPEPEAPGAPQRPARGEPGRDERGGLRGEPAGPGGVAGGEAPGPARGGARGPGGGGAGERGQGGPGAAAGVRPGRGGGPGVPGEAGRPGGAPESPELAGEAEHGGAARPAAHRPPAVDAEGGVSRPRAGRRVADYGKSNKVFTQDRADAARALLRKKLSQVNAGFDPEIMMAGFELAGYHVEAGARSFAAYSRAMIEDLGEAIRPYLAQFYRAVRDFPNLDEETRAQMDGDAAIDAELSEPATSEPVREVAPAPTPVEATDTQVPYKPASAGTSLDTLVPVNLQSAITGSLNAVQQRRGDLDVWVGRELGYTQDELHAYFSAEQIDAIALAVDNFSRGAGFIIGDQTGIGKGRVVAAMIRFAKLNGKIPIFVTEKPNLYGDMYRDLTDIGMSDMRPLMTNADEIVPLSDDLELRTKPTTHNALLRSLTEEGGIGDHDVVFTTYNQMQTVRGARTVRMDFLERIAPNAMVIFDESHNAGGQKKRPIKQTSTGQMVVPLDRARFARDIAAAAWNVFYSSATYAKRPDVMDLYAKTDMSLAVPNIDGLGEAISKGGVPMQQVVATMLARAGQYLRRERSFAGVTYETMVAETDVAAYSAFSDLIRGVFQFSDRFVSGAKTSMDMELKADAMALSGDGSTGGAGAESLNFTSIMHNLIDQMLVSSKAKVAADEAIAALGRGEKPVITVANTMGSFLKEYADAIELKPGQAIGITFNDLIDRYLERCRILTIRRPYQRGQGERIYLTDERLGPAGVEFFRNMKQAIAEADLGSLPVSPIDAITEHLQDAGYKVGEITGRTLRLETEGDLARLRRRRDSIRIRRNTISSFNDGTLDVIILNQAGATGLSLHASTQFKHQRKRRMILAQPEKNIDTHMQMLGRVHRTGQVVTPAYTQLVANVPAEKRPAAVLSKKMASLNANTTASRGGALTAKDVPDFINDYGDEVVASIFDDDFDLNMTLGRPLSLETEGFKRPDAARKVTGRIPLLPLQRQEELYDQIEQEYADYLQRLNDMGENALEARTLDLDQKVLETTTLVPRKSNFDSPFAEGADIHLMDVKRTGKPHSRKKVIRDLAQHLGALGEVEYPKLVQAGAVAQREAIAAELPKFEQFKADLLERTAEEHRAKEQTRLEGIEADWRSRMDAMNPGRSVLLRTDSGNVYGIVIGTKVTGKPKNPIALGSWKSTIYLLDSARQVTIPLSKIRLTEPTERSAGTVVVSAGPRDGIGGTPIIDMFDRMQAEHREQRWIVTGNLLAAFDAVGGRGSIINFRDEGGSRPGILMPKDFKFGEFAARQPVKLETVASVLAYVTGGSQPAVGSDSAIAVGIHGNRIEIRADLAKAKGGRYYLNQAVLDAAGEEFVSVGNGMVLRLTREEAGPVIQALIDTGAQFEAREDLDRARQSVEGAGRRYSVDQRPRGERSLTEPELREALGRAVSGPALQRLERQGIVRLVTHQDDLPAHLQSEDRIQGVFDQNAGVTYLVAENLSLETAYGVLLHELGVHYGLQGMLGPRRYALAMAAVRRELAQGTHRVTEAAARIPEGTPESHRLEETLAYLVEDPANHDLPFVRRVFAAIKTFLFRLGLRNHLSVDELVMLAQASVRRISRRSGNSTRELSAPPERATVADYGTRYEVRAPTPRGYARYVENATAGGGNVRPTSFVYVAEEEGEYDAKPLEQRARRSQSTRLVQTGTLRTGITRVRTPADVAHLVAPLRKEPQESVIAVVTDDEGQVLAVIRHTVGLINASAVEPHILVGAIHGVKGAKRVWFAHQHPSGIISQSREDLAVTRRLVNMLEGTGIEGQSMVVVAPGERQASVFTPAEGPGNPRIDIPARRRSAEVPVSERRLRRYTKLPEAFPRDVSPDDMVQQIREHLGSSEGLLILNTNLQAVGSILMSADEMLILRRGGPDEGASVLFRAVEQANGNGLVAVVHHDIQAAQNIGSFARDAGINFPDIFFGDDLNSARATGIPIEHSQPYFSVAPATAAFPDEIEERWQRARGGLGDRRSMGRRLVEKWEQVKHGFTRHHPDLPNDARFALANEALRQFEAAPQAAKEEAQRLLRRAVGDLTPEEYDLFSRKVVLDDLAWDAEQERDLPFGFTPETLDAARAAVDDALTPELRSRLDARNRFMEDIRRQLIEHKILTDEQARNPSYFRHQVLTYARLRQFAEGHGRELRKRRPGWTRSRHGTMEDINANYLEAEFEFLHGAMVNIKLAQTLSKIDRDYNRLGEAKANAKRHNAEALALKIASERIANPIAGSPTETMLDSFRQRIAMGFDTLARAMLSNPPNLPERFQDILDSIRENAAEIEAQKDEGVPADERTRLLDMDPETSQQLFPLLQWLITNGAPGSVGAATVFKAIHERRAFIRDALDRQYIDPMNTRGLVSRGMAPEGHVAWQPERGSVFYRTMALGEDLINRILDSASENLPPGLSREALEVALGQAREVLALGGPKPFLVIPEELASTLDNMGPDLESGIFDHVLAEPVRWWKQWVLINPRRVLKYNLNNLSGDLDAVIAGNPRALRKMRQAIGELYAVMKGGEPTARYREAVDRGVFDGGLSIQEIPDINALKPFESVMQRGARNVKDMTLSGLSTVWSTLRDYTRFRENWLRYAAYLDYVERLEAGESMREVGYGASKPEVVDELLANDTQDAAALLARQLVGDYGNVSYYGQGIRNKLIPFYSWMEINTGRYLQLWKNAYGQGIGAMGRMGAVHSAHLAIRMFVVYMLVQLWNRLFFEDEERELTDVDRLRMHIQLPRGEDGKVRLIRFQGALSDFLGWIGIEEAVPLIGQVEKGRAGWEDVTKAFLKAPINKIALGLTPVIKTPLELFSGMSFFPDVFNPRTIRDGPRHALRLFSLENEYDWLTRQPSRGYAYSLEETITTKRDVGELAYNKTQELVHDWNRRERGIEGRSSYTSPRSEALRDFRMAVRYGDTAARQRALERLQELGVGRRSLRQSIRAAHPLASIPKYARRAFLRTLSPHERETLQRAIDWYNRTYLNQRA